MLRNSAIDPKLTDFVTLTTLATCLAGSSTRRADFVVANTSFGFGGSLEALAGRQCRRASQPASRLMAGGIVWIPSKQPKIAASPSRESLDLRESFALARLVGLPIWPNLKDLRGRQVGQIAKLTSLLASAPLLVLALSIRLASFIYLSYSPVCLKATTTTTSVQAEYLLFWLAWNENTTTTFTFPRGTAFKRGLASRDSQQPTGWLAGRPELSGTLGGLPALAGPPLNIPDPSRSWTVI